VQEPPTNTALLQHPQVTCTPHLGASTVDAQTRVAVDIAKQFIAFSRQTALTGAVRIAECNMFYCIKSSRLSLSSFEVCRHCKFDLACYRCCFHKGSTTQIEIYGISIFVNQFSDVYQCCTVTVLYRNRMAYS